MIYKINQLKRMAAEMLCEFVMENKDYHFNNTSYGMHGEVLGTASYEGRASEHFVGYVLRHQYSEGGYKYELVKETEHVYYKTETQEHHKEENSEVLLTLYDVDYSDKVFTDDSEYSRQAKNIRGGRNRSWKTVNHMNRTWTIEQGTKLYDNLFNFIAKSKPQIKYGNPITVYKYAYETENYVKDSNGNWCKKPVIDVRVNVSIDYRKQPYCVEKTRFYLDK